MRIGVNTRLLLKDKLEGIGRFSHEILQRLTIQLPEVQFIFYFDRPFSEEFIYSSNVLPRVVYPPARHPFLYYVWFEWSLPQYFKKDKLDLFFSPDGFLSLSTKVPQMTVFHDLAFEHFPQGISKIGLWYYKKYMPRFANIAKHLFAVSHFTKNDIVKTYQVPEEKITVVCNGVSEQFKPLPPHEQQTVRNQYSQGKPYFLYVGSIHPRKNLRRLLLAFAQFKQHYQTPHQLLICGRKAWNFEDVVQEYEQMPFKEEVLFTGKVSDSELAKLYASAEALCYVSLWEGFGIPILEAFSCHTPVITSNISSMPEIAHDAAILVNPYEIDEIQNALFQISHNPTMKTQLVQKGQERLKNYSWQKAVDAMKPLLML